MPHMDTKNNIIALWRSHFPIPPETAHKYDRGHAVIFGAPELSGATRLAASACSRIGAGVVTVLAETIGDIYRVSLPADIIVKSCDIQELTKIRVMMGGPGGITEPHRKILYQNPKQIRRVFDAGAIPERQGWSVLDSDCILTPHHGEFERIFSEIDGVPQDRVRRAARACGAVIILKGAQSYLAHPDGRVATYNYPNPYLAKAGTGDVLAGFVTGLLAQGMPVFEAANAAVWIHSEAGRRLGPGLTACDLDTKVPEILKEIVNA